MTFKSICDVLFVQECICERIENQINFSNFQICLEVSFRGLKLEKCSLPYIYFVFICLIFFYFGIKKERSEKKFEYFFIGSEHP